MSEGNLTERQRKWFDSVRASLERETGKTLEEWAAIARTCPETGHRARLKWFKDHHGLMQNRASMVLTEAFPTAMRWDDPESLAATLWSDAAAAAVRDAIDARAMALGAVIRTQRKGYTAWSRKVQFAAARPLKGGGAMLGLAVSPSADPRLAATRNESWSERLAARLPLASADEVDDQVGRLLRAAWEKA